MEPKNSWLADNFSNETVLRDGDGFKDERKIWQFLAVRDRISFTMQPSSWTVVLNPV